jgi:hypothetical protein
LQLIDLPAALAGLGDAARRNAGCDQKRGDEHIMRKMDFRLALQLMDKEQASGPAIWPRCQ